MSGAVERLDLEGGLKGLSAQYTRVKTVKTSKLNLFKKALEVFDDDPDNLTVWEDVLACKEKADEYGEAFSVLLEAIIDSVMERLAEWTGDDESPLQARLATAREDLEAYDKNKQAVNAVYYRLAKGRIGRESSILVSDVKADTVKVKPADTIKPSCATLKLTPSEFQIWARKARGWVEQSNFITAKLNVQHLYLNAILDREVQQKVEALPEYEMADAFEVLSLVERVHDSANPLFVKRSNFYAAHRGGGEAGSAYIARVKVLADLAKLA